MVSARFSDAQLRIVVRVFDAPKDVQSHIGE